MTVEDLQDLLISILKLEIPALFIVIVIPALAWIIKETWKERENRRHHNLCHRLDFRTAQLEKLYGPLYFLVLEGEQAFTDLKHSFGRTNFYRNGLLTDVENFTKDEAAVWRYWVVNEFMPRNRKIRELLEDKSYLIEGNEMPNSFVQFLRHQCSWEIHTKYAKDRNEEIPLNPGTHWPTSFNEEVSEIFQELKKTHSSLIGKLELHAWGKARHSNKT